jgi:hypothetical protein
MEKCVVSNTDWDLSEGCLTSCEAQRHLLEILRTDPTLADKIKRRCGAIYLSELPLKDGSDTTGKGEEDVQDDHALNDSDVPLCNDVQNTLGLTVGKNQAFFEVTGSCIGQETGGLVAVGDNEYVFAYGENGVKWTDMTEPAKLSPTKGSSSEYISGEDEIESEFAEKYSIYYCNATLYDIVRALHVT